jgi:hypothetical protein
LTVELLKYKNYESAIKYFGEYLPKCAILGGSGYKARSNNRNMADKQSSTDSFEQKLWKAADKLRKNIDAAEYKHIVLGLIFLKYISDAFEELYQKLKAGEGRQLNQKN